MYTRSNLTEEALLPAIRQAYDLEVDKLAFLQRGWGGDCFLAETPAGERLFLKLHDSDTHTFFAASSRQFYLPLMDQLYSRGILTHIPHPRHTRNGDLSLSIDSRELVITQFIEGEVIGFGELPDFVVPPLAHMVATLHASLPQMAFEHPFIEGFEIAFEQVLVDQMVALGTVMPVETQGVQQLRTALLPRRSEIIRALDRLKTLQAYARAAHPDMVICHTDLHGANLMVDRDGNLYLLDWENAMIAPREHDMIFFEGEADIWDLFWPVYQQHFPQVVLDPLILEFYYHRRNLEDIADFILRIFQMDGGEARDRADLAELLRILNGMAAPS